MSNLSFAKMVFPSGKTGDIEKMRDVYNWNLYHIGASSPVVAGVANTFEEAVKKLEEYDEEVPDYKMAINPEKQYVWTYTSDISVDVRVFNSFDNAKAHAQDDLEGIVWGDNGKPEEYCWTDTSYAILRIQRCEVEGD